MFAMVADCEQKGTHRYAENYRARYREVWPITIGEYSSTCNFQDEETERSKIEIFYRNWLDEQLSKIDDKASIILFVLAVSIMVVCLIYSFIDKKPFTIIIRVANIVYFLCLVLFQSLYDLGMLLFLMQT